MKRLALLTYYFPPDGGVGSQRPRRIVEYAPASGWQVDVVTRTPPATRNSWEPEDASLAEGLAGSVHRLDAPEGSRGGDMVPGPRGADDPYLAAVLERLASMLAERPCDAVAVTMPPYGLSPLVEAAQDRFGLPVVVDLRDPWALDGAFAHRSRSQWAENMKWMRRVLTAADGVIANTPEARTQMLRAIPGLDAERIVTVSNGCVVDAFTGPPPVRPPRMDPARFHLVHTGTLHSSAFRRTRGLKGRVRRWTNHRAEPIEIGGRTPYFLLRAIARLRRERDPRVESLRLSLVGVDDGDNRAMIDASGVADLVDLVGFVPYEESLAWMRHADALFLPLFGLPAGRRSRIVPFKTYEYLASGRPILGALPEGDARDLVERSRGGRCADPCDDAGLAEALRGVIDTARETPTTTLGPEAWMWEYDWGRLMGRFFGFVDARAGGGAPGEVDSSSSTAASAVA